MQTDRLPGVTLPLVIAVVALGAALQTNYGQYHPIALAWLTVAIVATLAAVLRSSRTQNAARLSIGRAQRWVLMVGLSIEAMLLLSRHPGVAELGTGQSLLIFDLLIVAAIGSAVVALVGPARFKAAGVILLLAAYLAAGVWVIHVLPRPAVDVVVFQDDACLALLHGQNPYRLTFPDISPAGTTLYGPGASVNGRLRFGYPYPPASLLLTLPGYLLGDFRYAQLLAMTLAAGMLYFARPSALSAGAAALLLLTPRGFFVLQAGWTEPLVILGLAATVFVASRFPRRRVLIAIVLGLFLATKQYLVLALPATMLLPAAGETWTQRLRFVGVALVTAGVVTAPLALCDPKAFAQSAVLLQFHQPFRPDALSYLVPLSRVWQAPSSLIAFAAAGAASIISLRRCPRTPAGFSLALALTFFAFFAFNKQAFCNYYHFVIAALCIGL